MLFCRGAQGAASGDRRLVAPACPACAPWGPQREQTRSSSGRAMLPRRTCHSAQCGRHQPHVTVSLAVWLGVSEESRFKYCRVLRAATLDSGGVGFGLKSQLRLVTGDAARRAEAMLPSAWGTRSPQPYSGDLCP